MKKVIAKCSENPVLQSYRNQLQVCNDHVSNPEIEALRKAKNMTLDLAIQKDAQDIWDKIFAWVKANVQGLPKDFSDDNYVLTLEGQGHGDLTLETKDESEQEDFAAMMAALGAAV